MFQCVRLRALCAQAWLCEHACKSVCLWVRHVSLTVFVCTRLCVCLCLCCLTYVGWGHVRSRLSLRFPLLTAAIYWLCFTDTYSLVKQIEIIYANVTQCFLNQKLFSCLCIFLYVFIESSQWTSCGAGLVIWDWLKTLQSSLFRKREKESGRQICVLFNVHWMQYHKDVGILFLNLFLSCQTQICNKGLWKKRSSTVGSGFFNHLRVTS